MYENTTWPLAVLEGSRVRVATMTGALATLEKPKVVTVTTPPATLEKQEVATVATPSRAS